MAVYRTGVDRREEIVTDERTGIERTTQVVEDVGTEQNLLVARLINFVWLIAGIVEILFGLRFALKLLAANPSNGFASFVYGLTEPLLMPFRGLTITPTVGGMVLEISTLIAMFAYALLFWIIAELLTLLLSNTRARTVRVIDRDRDLR